MKNVLSALVLATALFAGCGEADEQEIGEAEGTTLTTPAETGVIEDGYNMTMREINALPEAERNEILGRFTDEERGFLTDANTRYAGDQEHYLNMRAGDVIREQRELGVGD